MSSTIGYILVLGILSLTIGITYAAGYPTLQNAIDSSHMQNMESGFIILGKNLDRVTSNDAPSQSVELKLKGGTLRTSREGMLTTTMTYVNGTSVTMDWEKMSISYSFRNREIGYECGGVMQTIDDTGYVAVTPGMVKGDPFIIPVNVLWGSDTGVAGDGLAKVTVIGGSPTLYQYDGVIKIDMTMTSDFYPAWDRYFKDTLGMTTVVDEPNGAVHATYVSDSPGEYR